MHNIGFVANGVPNNGGSFQYTLSMLDAFAKLPREEYRVVVFFTSEKWIPIVKKLQLEYCVLEEKRTWFLTKLEHILWKTKWPIVNRIYSYYSFCEEEIVKKNMEFVYAGDIRLAQKYKIPIAYPIHDLMHIYQPEIIEVASEYSGRENKYKRICKYSKIIFVDSELGKKHVVDAYGKHRKNLADYVKVLPYVPPTYIYETGLDSSIEKQLPQKYIFYPAQFWTHKNHIRLLEAIAKLRDDGILINVVFVGSEQNNEFAIRNKIEHLKLNEQIKILGYVSNEQMKYIYTRARALVMPTLFGPTNIPPLEAFYLGCPVATSKIYGIPEQLGDAAMLFDPYSVQEIADTVRRLWVDDDLCQMLVNLGHDHATNWNCDSFCKLLETYLSMLFIERSSL